MLCQDCALSVSSFERRPEDEMERNLAISALERDYFMTILSSCLLRKQIAEQSPLCPPHQMGGGGGGGGGQNQGY